VSGISLSARAVEGDSMQDVLWRSRRSLLDWLPFLLFVIASAYVTWHHEMWRDEIQDWLLARDSDSLWALFKNMRYEGHPPLWNMFLYFFAHAGLPIETKQVFSWSIGVGVASLLIFYSPFSRGERALLIFGYYFFYEYTVISRNYGISILLSFMSVICIFRQRVFLAWVCLALLCLTNFFAIVIASVVAVYFCFAEKTGLKACGKSSIFGVVVFGVTLFFSLLILAPPVDRMSFPPILYKGFDRALMSAYTTSFGLMPFINLEAGHSYSDGVSVVPVLAFFLLVVFFVFFRKIWVLNRRAAAAFCTVLISFSIFKYFLFEGSVRHYGMSMVAFMVFYWLAKANDVARVSDVGGRMGIGRVADLFFLCALGFSTVFGVVAAAGDVYHPFSNAKRAAEFFGPYLKPGVTVFADTDFAASALLGYTDFPSFFYRQGFRSGSFVRWDQHRMTLVPPLRKIDLTPFDYLVLTYKPLAPPNHFYLIGFFSSPSAIQDENYYFYKNERK
jgi:hypothetical protein